MENFKKNYKEPPSRFQPEESRQTRLGKQQDLRKTQRARFYNKNRNLQQPEQPETSSNGVQEQPAQGHPQNRLARWKAEREKCKQIEQMKKKPPFKVGLVHHRIYSPIPSSIPVPVINRRDTKPAGVLPNIQKRITRATEKRLNAKAAAEGKTTGAQIVTKQSGNKKKNREWIEESFAPLDHKFKAPSGLSNMPLFGRVTMSMDLVNSFGAPTPKRKTLTKKRDIMESTMKEHETPEEMEDNQVKIEDIPGEPSEPNCCTENKDRNATNADTSSESICLKLSFNDQDTLSSINKTELNTTLNSYPLNVSYTKETPARGSNGTPSDPVAFSPYVVSSRGKNNARKEEQLRRGIGCSPNNDIPTKETVMHNLNISIEDEERTSRYFIFLLDKEIDRLREICHKWTQIQSMDDVTEDGKYQIIQAVGQTNLLINKKFERFRGLVADCETGKGEMLVTCRDLQGFWDMMYMEVKDCDLRFSKLERLRTESWVEEQPPTKPVIKKKGPAKKKVVPTKTSSIRALILAKKKQMAEEGLPEDSNKFAIANKEALNKSGNRESNPSAKSHTKRMSLLQKVQLSERIKRMRSPLAAMKISQMCKTPEIRLNDSLAYITSNETPSKSILKRSKESVLSETRRKSAHKVNFNEQVVLNDIPVDEETQTKVDLGAALARIDSYEFSNECEKISKRVERMLDFENDSSDESLEDPVENTEHSEAITFIPTKKYVTPIPVVVLQRPSSVEEIKTKSRGNSSVERNLRKSVRIAHLHDAGTSLPITLEETEVRRASRKVLRRQNAFDESDMDDIDVSVKTLRNRVVSSKGTPRSKTRTAEVSMSAEETEQKENRSMNKISLVEDGDRPRRSTRRSVKFLTTDSSGCADGKTTMPMTPHTGRNRSVNLMSWDTPEKLPKRVGRSQSQK